MSLQCYSRMLRPHGGGRRISLLPSLFDVSTMATTTTMPFLAPSATRHYASRNPSRSPAARQKAKSYGKALPVGTARERTEIYADLLTRFGNQCLAMYDDGLRSGNIEKRLESKKFFEIGIQLISDASTTVANAQSINNICPGDPDRAFNVGNGIFRSNPWATHFGAWLYKSTADAGAVIPLALEILNQIKHGNGIVRRTVQTDLIIKIARERKNHLAQRIWAELLWLTGQKKDALELLTKLMDKTYASNTPGNARDDITLQGQLKQPWELMSMIYDSLGEVEKANEMMKLGALVYRDPTALVAYAYLMKGKDWEAYEQCLVVAATSSNGEACFRLANYYYNIYKGEIPSRDELNKRKKWFIRSSKKEDFRKMAMNWYELAALFGYMPAVRNYAVLLREDGAFKTAESVLQALSEKPEFWNSPNIVKLRGSFYDPDFKPALPPSWISL